MSVCLFMAFSSYALSELVSFPAPLGTRLWVDLIENSCSNVLATLADCHIHFNSLPLDELLVNRRDGLSLVYTYSTYGWHWCIYISRFGDFVSTTTITATTTELTFLHAHGVVNAKLVNACTCLYLSLTNSQVCFLPWDFFVRTKFTGCNWHMPSCAYFRSNIIHILCGGKSWNLSWGEL